MREPLLIIAGAKHFSLKILLYVNPVKLIVYLTSIVRKKGDN